MTRLRLAVPMVVLLTVLCSLGVVGVAHAGKIEAIVHPDNPIQRLTVRDVERFFKVSKKQWADGEQVVLLFPPAKSEAINFLVRNVFKVRNMSAVSMFYLKAIFQQKITVAPEPAANVQDAVRKISRLRGGMTLIDAGSVPVGSAVRIVPVE